MAYSPPKGRYSANCEKFTKNDPNKLVVSTGQNGTFLDIKEVNEFMGYKDPISVKQEEFTFFPVSPSQNNVYNYSERMKNQEIFTLAFAENPHNEIGKKFKILEIKNWSLGNVKTEFNGITLKLQCIE